MKLKGKGVRSILGVPGSAGDGAVLRCLLMGAVTLLCVVDSFSQSIHFAGDRVVVDRLDGEVLYTFTRYQNKQEVWNEVFPVRVHGAFANISGGYEVGDSTVTFVPDFPFTRGVEYEATFFAEELAGNANEVHLPRMSSARLDLNFKLDESNSPAPVIKAVYPTSGELPENLLRFHIEFSSPMTRGDVYKRVHLLDENKREVENAILIVDEELWDDEMHSVTVMLDPGRIKRGLRANLEMKPPMIAGRKYSLVVDAGWKNSEGVEMKEKFTKTFRCYSADRSRPAADRWTLIAPSKHDAPLIIKMKESFDITLARNAIVVQDARGKTVEGTLTVSEDESILSFKPRNFWSNESYTVLVNPKLEDLAGNNFERPFDTDVNEKVTKASAASPLVFSVR